MTENKPVESVPFSEQLKVIIHTSASYWEALGRVEETIGLDVVFYLLATRSHIDSDPEWYSQFVEKITNRTINFYANVNPVKVYDDQQITRVIEYANKVGGDKKIELAAREWVRYIVVVENFQEQRLDPPTRLRIVLRDCLKTVRACCSSEHQELARKKTWGLKSLWPMPDWLFEEKFHLAFSCLSVLANQKDRDKILDHLLSIHYSPGEMLYLMLTDGNYPLESFERVLDFHLTDCRSTIDFVRYQQKLANPLNKWNVDGKTTISNAISSVAQKAVVKAKESAATVDDWTALLKANIVSLAEVEPRFRDADFAVWQIIAAGVLQPTDELANILMAKAKTRDQLVIAFKNAKTESKKEEIFRTLLTCPNATFEHYHEIFKGCEQHDRDGRDFCAIWWPQTGFYAEAFGMMEKLMATDKELNILINYQKHQTPEYG